MNNKKIIVLLICFIAFFSIVIIYFLSNNRVNEEKYYTINNGKIYLVDDYGKKINEVSNINDVNLSLYFNNKKICESIQLCNRENDELIIIDIYSNNLNLNKINVLKIDLKNNFYEIIKKDLIIYYNSIINYDNGKYNVENRFIDCKVKYSLSSDFENKEAVEVIKYDDINNFANNRNMIAPVFVDDNKYENKELAKTIIPVSIIEYSQNIVSNIENNFNEEFEKLKENIVLTDNEYDFYFYEISLALQEKYNVVKCYEFYENGDKLIYNMNSECYFDDYLKENKFWVPINKNNHLKTIYLFELENESGIKKHVLFALDYV